MLTRQSIAALALLACLACAVCISAEPEYGAGERSHWSLVPRRPRGVPEISSSPNAAWVVSPVDAFVLSALEKNGLAPAAPASPETLLRRVHFDLTGLPPAPELLAEYLEDPSADAYERLVDRLLGSPRYGERWGQHWLDVVRYAETEGFEYDRHRSGAWRFRDYVARSFNADKPFDRFLVEQIAGDELADTAADEAAFDLRVAAGFHRLGPVRRNAGNTEVAFSRNEVLTEMTDAIGAAFLGLTLACARCHDHMFDPIRQRDYYQMQAYFAGVHEHDVPLAEPSVLGAWQAKTNEVNARLKEIKEALENATGDEHRRLELALKETEKQLPAPLDCISSVRNEGAQRTPIHVLQRGASDKPGERVLPRPLGVLLPEGAAPLDSDAPRPRTQLAQWLASAEHPLTARVLVNRVWQYHFGQGLVRTPNDFGTNGDLPSHPELLDFLAEELIRAGWRLKPLHRLIVLSSAYRQGGVSLASGRGMQIDPGNRLLWRFSRRRLSAEELRDAMLAASGRLNLKEGGPSIMVPVERELVDLLYKPSQWAPAEDAAERDRRSLYLIAKRNLRLPFLEVFDQPDLQTSCPRREGSIHAPQALELLNGALSNELAEAFAARLRGEAGPSAERQVELAFRIAVGRPPTPEERRRSIEFLARGPLREFALAMFNLNAFVFVD